MEIPGLFFLQRPSGPADGSALLRLRDGRRVAGREKGEFGLSEALNSSPPSAARHPLNQQRVWAVIYASRSGDGARFLKNRRHVREVSVRVIFLGARRPRHVER